MEGSDSSRSRNKRDVEDSGDARGSLKKDEERADIDDCNRSSAGKDESRRKSVTSPSRAYIGDEDDHDVRRESRSSKFPRRSPEEKSERRSSDGYKDRDVDSGRRRREDANDLDSSRRSSFKTSGHDVSHSKSRSKSEGPYEGQHERSSREKQGHLDQEDKSYQMRVESTQENAETKDKLPHLNEDGRAPSRDGGNAETRHDNRYRTEKNEGDRDRELEGSEHNWSNRQRLDLKEANDEDAVTEWRHGKERLDGGNFHSRSGYRKDSRGRHDSSKGPSLYGNRYDSSDSIEIRPNRNLDFGRESSLAVRRTDTGSNQDLTAGTNDPPEENKKSYGNDENSQEQYYDVAENMDLGAVKSHNDSQIGTGGLKGPMSPNTSGAGHSPVPQQGPKGVRSSRGLRGRPNCRDPQRVGVPVHMMPPQPFGPLGLPPGPMQPMGPNMSHSPGHLGPGVFLPPFPGPLLWPGARGVDMNMVAIPPNLSIPPVAGSMFATSVGAGANYNIQLAGRETLMNVSGSGFSPVATPSREMMQNKPPAGWTPQRNSGPAGKAPSRGEQNDYSQNFVDTGMRPQNFIRELELTNVVEDYPKLRELIQRKDDIVSNSASAPMYYKCDLKEHVLTPEFFGTKFDVILVDPPWEEYVHRAPGITDHIEYWTPEEIMNLKIEAIADTPSFLFLWVGDGVGLEQGRQCLKKWGFRRCEDICWLKTNKKNATPGLRHDSNTYFQHSKEHCLMGIKGTVRRSTDGHIIHANIDTDIIIAEEPTDGSTQKPEDMYRIIEHFALGRRRLELFGEDHNIRPGWLTLGSGLSSSNFNKEAYIKNFMDRDGKLWQGGSGRNPPPDAPHLVVTTPEIESLRPKSPPHKNQQQQSIGSSSSANRRPANTSQNVVTVVGSETVMPAGWPSTPFGMPSGGADSEF